MKAMLLNSVVGLVLFAAALLGGLFATGRLNHEGVGHLPLLGGFFPPPPPDEAAAADAILIGKEAQPAEASDGGEQGEETPRRQKVGRSVEKPDEKPADSGGEQAGKDSKGAAAPKVGGGKAGQHPAERDFALQEQTLAEDRRNRYSPGGLFRFEGLPTGLTPEQVNDAWQRVQAVLVDLEQRKAVLDQREKDLQILSEDIDQRRRKLTEKMVEIENEARKLDARIAAFAEQVKLVRSDEIAALRKNAQSYSTLEPSKVAELVTDLWRTEKGQEEVLKTFEFMDKDRVNEILEQLPNPTVLEFMRKRMRVSREAVPSAGPGR